MGCERVKKLSVVIPFVSEDGHRRAVFEYVVDRWVEAFPDCEIVVGVDSKSQPFSRSSARNDGVAKSTGEILAIADADTVANPEFLHSAFELAHELPWVFPYRVYYNLNSKHTRHLLQVRNLGILERPEVSQCEHAIPSVGGIFFLKRKDFLEMGGYDERFVGWGYEDDAFYLAADTILGRHETVVGGWVAHLWHLASNNDRFGQPAIAVNRGLYDRYFGAYGNPEKMREVIDG